MAFLDALIGGGLQLGASQLNYQNQKKLAEQQNQFNLDMWRMNNEYNSPQAQMKRFEQAGLNPNLIYGQGTAGNSSSPPQMTTPQAPKYDKAAAELSRAFNIEGIRTMIANRKAAQAEADIKRTAAERAKDEYLADQEFSRAYTYDPQKGLYRPWALGDDMLVYSRPAVLTYQYNRLSNNYRDNNLSSIRRNLMGSQFGLNISNKLLQDERVRYLGKQYQMLEPQISMLNYQSKFFPYTFWIGNVSKGLQALPLPRFNFRFGNPSSVVNSTKFNYFY